MFKFGDIVTDKVSNFTGKVTGICEFDTGYKSIQVTAQGDGTKYSAEWFQEKLLTLLASKKPLQEKVTNPPTPTKINRRK